MNRELLAAEPTIQMAWYWPLLLSFPLLVAGGMIEKTRNSPSLPEAKSYRSDLSDLLTESSSWRKEDQDSVGWREPPPATRWRTSPSQQAESASTASGITLFPKYRSGDPAVFDFSTREEKGQIKVFEFGH